MGKKKRKSHCFRARILPHIKARLLNRFSSIRVETIALSRPTMARIEIHPHGTQIHNTMQLTNTINLIKAVHSTK